MLTYSILHLSGQYPLMIIERYRMKHKQVRAAECQMNNLSLFGLKNLAAGTYA